MRAATIKEQHIEKIIKRKLEPKQQHLAFMKIRRYKQAHVKAGEEHFNLMIYNLYLDCRGHQPKNYLMQELNEEHLMVLKELRIRVMWIVLRLHAVIQVDPAWKDHSSKRERMYHIACPWCFKKNVMARHTFNHWVQCPYMKMHMPDHVNRDAIRLQALFTYYKQQRQSHIPNWNDLLTAHYIIELSRSVSEYAGGLVATTCDFEKWYGNVNNVLKSYNFPIEKLPWLKSQLSQRLFAQRLKRHFNFDYKLPMEGNTDFSFHQLVFFDSGLDLIE